MFVSSYTGITKLFRSSGESDGVSRLFTFTCFHLLHWHVHLVLLNLLFSAWRHLLFLSLTHPTKSPDCRLQYFQFEIWDFFSKLISVVSYEKHSYRVFVVKHVLSLLFLFLHAVRPPALVVGFHTHMSCFSRYTHCHLHTFIFISAFSNYSQCLNILNIFECSCDFCSNTSKLRHGYLLSYTTGHSF